MILCVALIILYESHGHSIRTVFLLLIQISRVCVRNVPTYHSAWLSNALRVSHSVTARRRTATDQMTNQTTNQTADPGGGADHDDDLHPFEEVRRSAARPSM